VVGRWIVEVQVLGDVKELIKAALFSMPLTFYPARVSEQERVNFVKRPYHNKKKRRKKEKEKG
jgi:hypothetical protein